MVLPARKRFMRISTFLVFGIFIMATTAARGETYYVNAEKGMDSNPGNSKSKAWKTLIHVNKLTLQPGDQLLLKAGTSYTGELKITGRGTKAKPILVGKFGGDKKPAIHGGGIKHAVRLYNVEHITVRDLEITNKGSERLPSIDGVWLCVEEAGTVRDIRLTDLYIHDIYASNKKKQGGCGIRWSNGGEKKTRYDGLTIENCTLERCDRNGIIGFGYWDRKSWHPNLNVVIRNNYLEDIGGDCIMWAGCDGALIERNVIRGGRMRTKGPAAGIWPWCSDNSIVQYNDVSGMKGTFDGQSFDTDDNSIGTIFQYNFSHDNEGGFMLICCVGDGGRMAEDTIIRYNISQNDGSGGKPPFRREPRIFHFAGMARNTLVHNNVFYIKPGMKTLFIHNTYYKNYPQYDGWAVDAYFYNNIIFADGEMGYKLGQKTKFLFKNNVFYGKHKNLPKTMGSITRNPMLVEPGSAKDIQTVDGYRLQSGSPCIGQGIPVPGNAMTDWWKTPVRDTRHPNIGPDESTGKN